MPETLQERISERIQQEGAITFAEYMRMALYEPGYGYYVSGPVKVGWQGDYYTSTDVSDFFAHCMGRQLHQMWEQLGSPTAFVVLEQGSGRGNLARGIQMWAAQEAPAFKAALDYRAEDIRSGQDALQSALTPAVMLSNELIDAFPVHIVEKRDGILYEVYVNVHEGHLREVLGKVSSQEVADYLPDYQVPWQMFENGWRAEINLAALRWMKRAAQMLMGTTHDRKRHGFLLIIDYGEKAQELYTAYRQEGTLACYFQHQLTGRPLVRPGQQDITAHVNFTALIDAGQQQGLQLQTFTSQRQWLTEMGIYEELEGLRTSEFAAMDNARSSNQGQIALLQWYNLRQRVTALTDPTGMGNFKVLILG